MDILEYIRVQLNKRLIKNNALVVGEMQRYYEENGRPEHMVKRMGLLLGMLVRYVILKKNPLRIKQNKAQKQIYPESSVNWQIPEVDLLKKIEKADLIIFDIWNVLVCPGLSSRHLLALLETIINCPGFSTYSDSAFGTKEGCEDSLKKIALDFCLDNEYMHHMWNCARGMGKKIFLCNNSDFNDAFIREAAAKFSYEGKIIHEKLHTGLYITADSKNRTGIVYQNVNKLGEPYRPFYRENIITVFYNRIVNLKFHAGQVGRNIFYEYGFACGGILTCGFCQYLNELVKHEKIDKLLFVARDGDIINKIYDKYFKECDTAYLYFSRAASYELIFEDFPEEYIEKNVKGRIKSSASQLTIGAILKECGLTCLEKGLIEYGISSQEVLNDSNFEKVQKFLLINKQKITDAFLDSSIAAKQYFLQEIEGCSNVCVVDLGWRGTSTVYLKHLFKKYGWNGIVKGALIGAVLDDVTQIYMRNGMLYAYAFDNDFYRRTGPDNGEYMLQEELFCIEALFSSVEPTLLRYKTKENGNYGFIFDEKNPNREMTAEIQKGIMDYAETCAPTLQKYHLRILPRDAYTPLDACMKNMRYRKLVGQACTGK